MKIIDHIKKDGNIWLIRVKITPNQPKNDFFSLLDDGTLKIRIKAIPEKGKANKELIKFLSEELLVAKDNIEIIAWAADQIKIIRIRF